MKIEIFSSILTAKYIYVAEKLLEDDFLKIPTKEEVRADDAFAAQFDMTPEELGKIWEELEQENLLIPNYSDTELEGEYYELTLDRVEAGTRISRLKKSAMFRAEPRVTRETTASIAYHIQKNLHKQEWIKVAAFFDGEISIPEYLYEDKYSLTDYLFSYAYLENNAPHTPFFKVLAEFFNPVYWSQNNEKAREQTLKYINTILSSNTDEYNYKEWLEKSAKYTPTNKQEEEGINYTSKKKKKKISNELNLPKRVQWEKVTLRFKEGLRQIEIHYGKQIKTYDYTDLGFYIGEKQPKIDNQWCFLCILSGLIEAREQQATPENIRHQIPVFFSPPKDKKSLSKDSVHQIKRKLSEKLQELFQTEAYPFEVCKNDDNDYYYKPNFTLKPSPTLRHKEPWDQGGELNENYGYDIEDPIE